MWHTDKHTDSDLKVMTCQRLKLVWTLVATFKSLWRTFTWLWRRLKLILMLHILSASANETIGEEIGDYSPVFHSVFARSAQSVETLPNALWHTDRKRQFVVYKHDWSTVLFFYYLLLEAGGYFSLNNFNIWCLWPNWCCANKWRVSFTLFQNKCSHYKRSLPQ